jgi:hypothetical protein
MSQKAVCFIHSTNMDITGTFILDMLLSYMNKYNTFDKLHQIIITNIGIPLDENKYRSMHPNIIPINYSNDASLFENATMKQVIYFSKLHPDYKVLYLHTKGVSYKQDHYFYPGIISWINYMLYCLVGHAENCMQLLNTYDTVGTNIKEHDANPIHYSGNFWWAKASYLQQLPITIFKEKYDCEFFTLSKNPKWFNIMKLHQMYEISYHPSIYEHIVNDIIKAELEKIAQI